MQGLAEYSPVIIFLHTATCGELVSLWCGDHGRKCARDG